MSNGDAKRSNPASNGHVVRTIAAIILAFIGIVGSVQLLRSHLIAEGSFIALSVASSFFGFAVAFIDRVQSFGSAAFKIDFARLEEARKEIEAREARVRRIAHIVSEITLFSAAFQNRCLGEGDSQKQMAWHEAKVSELLRTTEATPEERSKVFSIFGAMKRMDGLPETLDPDERDRQRTAIHEEIYQQIANDLNPMA